jgi:hypothetical protein
MNRKEMEKEAALFGRDPESDPGNHQAHGGEDSFGHKFNGSQGGAAGQDQPAGQAPAANPQLKDLYRALVRRLHPDVQGAMSAQRKEWWHQAQAAYESGDVAQLELLLTLCEIDDHGTTTRTSVSLLMRITRQFRSSLRTLKSRIGEYRLDPAWHFSAVQDRRPLLDQSERLLKSELFDLQRTLAALNAQLEGWARQARRAPVTGAARGRF